jgi:hypothetical protein
MVIYSNKAEQLMEGYLLTIHDSLEGHKEFKKLEAKLENRRLDFDAKLNKVQKSKKENNALEEETRVCQSKYEETLEAVTRRMIELNTSDDQQHHGLLQFVDYELEYFENCAALLRNLKSSLQGDGIPQKTTRKPYAAFEGIQRAVSTGKINAADILSTHEAISRSNSFQRVGSDESVKQISNRFEQSKLAERQLPEDTIRQLSSRFEQPKVTESQFSESIIPISRNLGAMQPQKPQRPVPASQNTQKQVRVLFDFDAESPNELSSIIL